MNSPVSGASAAAGVALAHVIGRDVVRPTAALLMQSGGASPVIGRIAGIDAARGIAMVLVCLSHVRIYFIHSAPALYEAVTALTRLGTPSFLLLSGFVAAHVLGSAQKGSRAALIDRALFLLLIGHLLIGLGDLNDVGALEWLFGRVVVTDAIGVCLLIAVLLRERSARTPFILGVSAMLIAWPVALFIAPESQVASTAGAVLFHLKSVPTALVDAALVPYLGLFLVGMGLRKLTDREVRAGDAARLARRLFLIGAVVFGCALLGVAGWYLAKWLGPLASLSPDARALLRATLDPSGKLPPSPAYFLAYGGGALFIAAFCLYCRPRRIVQPLVEWTAAIGKASLMCFILQDWLLRLVPALTGLDALASPTFWLLYFAATLLVLQWAAVRWRAARGNRFLTVGLRALASRQRA